MSVEQDIFLIGVTGSRKNITRMLNAAIRNVAGGDPITEGDDIDTINLKLDYFTGREGHNIGIFDLLDEECMKDDAVIARKEAFYNKVKACANCPFDCPNSKLKSEAQPLEYGSKEMEEYCPWPDPYDAEDSPTEPSRYIELVRVEEGEQGYTAKFSWYLYECYGPSDWADWEDIARLYDCRVFVDDNYYRNGQFIRFESATIYEPDGKEHRYGSGSTREEYDEFMDKLAELYPERYIPIRERYLEEKEAEKMRGLKEEEDEKERQRLEEEHQIKLNQTVWSRFASWEEDGVKAIRRVYDGLLWDMRNYRLSVVGSYFISDEEILNVLKVRAEKWKGVNDEFAGCYEELIRSFNEYCDTKKECKYDCVWDFCEGLARVCKDKKYGFIDTSGREVVPCKYDDARDFREGMAYVKLQSDKTITFNTGWTEPEGCLCGYIDKTGREVIPCQYRQGWDFSDGLAKVSLGIWDPDMPEPDVPFYLPSDIKWFFIDKTGAVVLEDAEDIDCFFDGLSRISRNGKTGFVDRNGHEVIPCKYDGAHQFCEGMTIVREDHLLPEDEQTEDMDFYSTEGFIDKVGREVVPCGKYDDLEEYHEGLARVSRDGKAGFVDKNGYEVIPCEYDWAHDFQEGLALAKKDGEECYIDKDRRVVLKLAELGVLSAWDFSDGLAAVICEPGGKRGYINKAGQLVIPCKYDEVHDFRDGLAMVKENSTWGFIDKTGQMVLPRMYNE
jgi:hypothetical protein